MSEIKVSQTRVPDTFFFLLTDTLLRYLIKISIEHIEKE